MLSVSVNYWGVFIFISVSSFNYFGAFLIKEIIPLALVGYGMIIANSALCASLVIYHLISNARLWNNKVHKNGRKNGKIKLHDKL